MFDSMVSAAPFLFRNASDRRVWPDQPPDRFSHGSFLVPISEATVDIVAMTTKLAGIPISGRYARARDRCLAKSDEFLVSAVPMLFHLVVAIGLTLNTSCSTPSESREDTVDPLTDSPSSTSVLSALNVASNRPCVPPMDLAPNYSVPSRSRRRFAASIKRSYSTIS